MAMLTQWLKKQLAAPVERLSQRMSSRPDKHRVHTALSALYAQCMAGGSNRVLVMQPSSSPSFIIFSDQHKGARDGSDDFAKAAPVYAAALQYYVQQGFHLVSLGDEEELWENSIRTVKTKNAAITLLQQQFLQRGGFTKLFGNHDIYWDKDPRASWHLRSMYAQPLPVYEAVLLKLTVNNSPLHIFLTHGHQGDGQSDGNWFSAWFVASVWAPLQAWLGINTNTPSVNNELKTTHNRFMYEWSRQAAHPVLITGHTHQPVFASLTHIERLYKKLNAARVKADAALEKELLLQIEFRQREYDDVVENYQHLLPCYFNTGCCCFNDGDITGIEIAGDQIRLVKWHQQGNSMQRKVLEEMPLHQLLQQ